MTEPSKPHTRKRSITGWRTVERKRSEIRARHRHPPPAPVKREA